MIRLQPKTLIVWRSPWIGGKPFCWGKYDGARWSSAWWCLPPERMGNGQRTTPISGRISVIDDSFSYEICILSKDKSLRAPACLVFLGAVVTSNGVASNNFWRNFGCSTFPVLQTVCQCSWTWEACEGMFPELIWMAFHFASGSWNWCICWYHLVSVCIHMYPWDSSDPPVAAFGLRCCFFQPGPTASWSGGPAFDDGQGVVGTRVRFASFALTCTCMYLWDFDRFWMRLLFKAIHDYSVISCTVDSIWVIVPPVCLQSCRALGPGRRPNWRNGRAADQLHDAEWQGTELTTEISMMHETLQNDEPFYDYLQNYIVIYTYISIENIEMDSVWFVRDKFSSGPWCWYPEHPRPACDHFPAGHWQLCRFLCWVSTGFSKPFEAMPLGGSSTWHSSHRSSPQCRHGQSSEPMGFRFSLLQNMGNTKHDSKEVYGEKDADRPLDFSALLPILWVQIQGVWFWSWGKNQETDMTIYIYTHTDIKRQHIVSFLPEKHPPFPQILQSLPARCTSSSGSCGSCHACEQQWWPGTSQRGPKGSPRASCPFHHHFTTFGEK